MAHGLHFTGSAIEAASHLRAGEQLTWLARLHAEHDKLECVHPHSALERETAGLQLCTPPPADPLKVVRLIRVGARRHARR